MRFLVPVAAVALTVAMGVHVMRAYLAMIVWNIAVERSQAFLAVIAFTIWGAGLTGWLLALRRDPVRSAHRLAILLPAVYVANHFIAHPIMTPALALLSIVVWLWFTPVLVEALTRCGAPSTLALGILVGFAVHGALQAALHGLDMPMLRGVLPGFGAAMLGSALLASTYLMRPAGPEQVQSGQPSPTWGMITLGPYIVLQLTFLANAGRMGQMFGSAAVITMMLGFTLGVAAQPLARFRVARIAALAVPFLILFMLMEWPAGTDAWSRLQAWTLLIVIMQMLLAIALIAAVTSGGSPWLGRPHLPGAIGMLIAFGFVFLFYSRYEWTTLWPIMAAFAVAPAVFRAPHGMTSRTHLVALAFILILATVVVQRSRETWSQKFINGDRPAAHLRVLSYNIHMGFNAYGVPDPSAIATVIERSDPDVVALQEVGRGWNVNGGADLAAWLRWRFPAYHFVYGPMNGDLWGNVILSRYAILDGGSVRFPVRESKFQRGLTWILISAAQGDLLVINAHLAHDSASDRLAQAGDVLSFWNNRARTILLGDFNEGPNSSPIRRLLAAGFADALAPHGLETMFTFPSTEPSERLDYILISRDLLSTSGAIPQTTASDHLPVNADITVRP